MDITKIQAGNKKPKGRLFLILGVIITLLLLVVVFLFTGKEEDVKEETFNVENVKYLVKVAEDNPYLLELYNYKDDKKLDEVDLTEFKKRKADSEEADSLVLYATNKDLSKTYVYLDGNVVQYEVKEDKLKRDIIIYNENLEGTINIFLEKEKLFLVSSNSLYELDVKNKKLGKEVNVNAGIEYLTKLDDNYYYLVGSKLYEQPTKDSNEVRMLDLIDKPTDIRTIDGKLYIVSPFGSSLDNNLLFRLNTKTFTLDTLLELKYGRTSLLTNYDSESLYLANQSTKKQKNYVTEISTDKIMSIKESVEIDEFLENGKEFYGLTSYVSGTKLFVSTLEKPKTVTKFDIGKVAYYSLMQ